MSRVQISEAYFTVLRILISTIQRHVRHLTVECYPEQKRHLEVDATGACEDNKVTLGFYFQVDELVWFYIEVG